MKILWTEEEPQFKGEFCSFPKVRMYPKPAQKPHPPIVFGGESTPALKRVAEIGDGWFGVNVTVEDAQRKLRASSNTRKPWAVARQILLRHFAGNRLTKLRWM